MTSDTERSLEEAMRRYGVNRWHAPHLFNALRAALPEGVVITRDGLARVERVTEWADETYVFTITPLDGER